MYYTRKNTETIVEILAIITAKRHTVSDALDILNIASRTLRDKAIVPTIDYRQEFNHIFETMPEED